MDPGTAPPAIERRGWRRTHAGLWDEAPGEPPGPPPRLSRLAASAYIATGLVSLAVGYFEYLDRRMAHRFTEVGVFVAVAAYCFALAAGAFRIRSRREDVRASARVCMPILVHATAGLSGAVCFLLEQLNVRIPNALGTVAGGAAMGGLLFGWGLVFLTFLWTRRGGLLLVSAVAGLFVLPVGFSIDRLFW